ncbi:MAG: glycine oxidase ThiO [Mariprofundales bacterium]
MDGLFAMGSRVSEQMIVVGGGIIGCLTACRLRQQGVGVTLIESGEVGREASWAGAGILCPIQPWLYPDAFTVLIQSSLDLYPQLQAYLLDQTGVDIGWRRSGLMVPFFGDEPHWQAAQDWSHRFGWQVEQQDAATARKAEPTLAHTLQRALLWPQVAQLRNPRLLKAVQQWMVQLGVEVRSNTKVQQLSVHDGAIRGVVLADGDHLDAERVLLAAGSWSDVLLKPLGVSLSIRPVKGQIVLLKTDPGTVHHIVKHDDIYLVPRDDGRVLVGATMEDVGFREGNTVAEVHGLLDGVVRMFPGLASAVIEQQWIGFRPGSPDGMPFLGEIAEVSGLFVASGHYRNGVALAPITAQSMAELMVDRSLSVDLSSFFPARKVDPSSKVGYSMPSGGRKEIK